MSSTRRGPLRPLLLILAALALVAAACGGDGDDTSSGGGSAGTGDTEKITLYSGRDEELVQPVIDQFTADTGIEVEVRYGNSAEMAQQILEEGDATPADVFYSQEVGAVGALANDGLLTALPGDVVNRVDERFQPDEDNLWVGVTGRSRVIVYNPDLVPDPPAGVMDLTDPQYKDMTGWVPGNAGFQAFITAFRVSQGEEAAAQWLDDMIANGAQTYEGNTEVLEAVNSGELPIGLINHYYWARMRGELGDGMKAAIVFPKGDDPGGLVNATAVGITKNGADKPASLQLVEYLLGEAAQTYFVTETFEYPVVDGIADPEGVPSLDELEGPDIDLTDLESIEATQALLTEKGLLS